MGATNGFALHSDDSTRLLGGSPFCPKVDQWPRAARSLGVSSSAIPSREDVLENGNNSSFEVRLTFVDLVNYSVFEVVVVE